jgi:peptide deformylase
LLARAIQHETDHLDGVLFVDRLDPGARAAAFAELEAAEWAGVDAYLPVPEPVVKVSPH